MFGIGSTELLVILVVALIVLGPKSLASVSRSLGRAMGEFRRVSTDFQRTLNVEAAADDARQEAARRREAAAQQETKTPASAEEKTDRPVRDEAGPPPDSPLGQAIAKAKAAAGGNPPWRRGMSQQERKNGGAGQQQKLNSGEPDEWGVAWNWWDGGETGPDQEKTADDPQKLETAGKKDAPGDEKGMGLLDHLNELRQRLARSLIAAAAGFGVCWAFVDQLFEIVMRPLMAALPAGTHAQYTTLPEAFFTRMEIAFVAGLFLASPAIFYQIWAFVAPGLYDEEKKYIIPIAFLSALFFIAGGLFCYFIVFPFAFSFFISYSTPEIMMTPKISDYLSFVLKLIFAFGLIFEMPIFTLFLARLGILTAAMMRRARKYAIVVIFILAAILTPPDVISQLLMACPMLLLYELSIGVAAIFGRRPSEQKAEAESGEEKA